MKITKKLLIVLALFLLCGFFLTACDKDDPDGDGTGNEEEDVATVTLSASTLSIMEGNTGSLTFTSDKTVTVQWTTSDAEVATVTKNSDGSATVTALKVGTATITLKVLYNNKITEYKCDVTVTEYENEELRVTYSDSAAVAEHYTLAFDKDEYAYNETAELTISLEEGYMFTKILVGDREFNSEEFTRNTDGTYEISFTVSDKVESVSYTVTVLQMLFTKNISSDAVVTGVPTTVKMGETYNFTAELAQSKPEDEYLLVVIWNGSEIEPEEDGSYTIVASRASNSLEISVGKKHKVIDQSYSRSTDPAGDSKIVDLGTASKNGVLIATFKYDNAATAESFQFGVRFYNDTTFITRMDIALVQGVMAFKDSKSGATFVVTNSEDIRQRLVSGNFGVVIIRTGTTFTVYITDGEGLVQAFETTISDFTGKIGRIGSTMSAGMAAGEIVSFHYDYYDGEQDYTKFINVATSSTGENVEISGLATSYRLWQRAQFTITPEGTYEITSVRVNGVVVSGTVGSNNSVTYSIPVTDINGFDVVVEVSDPSVPASLVWENDANSTYTITEGEKDAYMGTDVVKFTVEAISELYKINFVKFNDVNIYPEAGVYTITLNAGENEVLIEAVSIRVNGEMTYTFANGSEVASGDQPSNILNHILSPSGTNTLVAIIGFKEALAQTAAKWRVDLRFYGGNSKTNFLAISFGQDTNGISISNRFASGNTLYYKDVVDGDVDEAAVLNMLAAGTLSIGIVKTGRVYTIYSDNGKGKMICLGDITMTSGITATESYFTIGFGGTVDALVNNNTRHCSMIWGYYDNFGNDKIQTAFNNFFAMEIVPSVTPDEDEKASIIELEESYNLLDTVTFKVNVADGYVAKVMVNGTRIVSDNNGNYSFVVTSRNIEIVITSELVGVQPSVTIEGTAQIEGIDEEGYNLNDIIEFSVVNTVENAEVTVTINGEVVEAVDDIYSYLVVDSTPVAIRVRAIDLSKATLTVIYDSNLITLDGLTASTEVDACNILDLIKFRVVYDNYTGYTFVGIIFNGERVVAQDGEYSFVLDSGENTMEILTEELVGVNYQKTVTTKSGAYSLNNDQIATNTTNAVLVSKVGFIPGTTTSLLNKNGTFDIMELRSRAGSANFLVYARINATVQDGVVTKLTLTNRNGTAASMDYVNTEAVWNLLINNNLTIVCVRTLGTHFTLYSDNGLGELVKMIEYDMLNMASDFTQFGIGVQNDPTANYYGDTLKLNLTWYAGLTKFLDIAELSSLTYTGK